MKPLEHNGDMCLIAFQWQLERPVPLFVVGNRDEFYDRPTAPLAWWEGGGILAGRDLKAGGTWLGVTLEGRFAALTNYRDPGLTKPDRASRGQIPLRFLEGGQPGRAFLDEFREEALHYNPFNLLLFDGKELLGYESHHDRVRSFTPGIHVLSNGDFDAPWPKAEALKAGLASAQDDDETLLTLLRDTRPFGDDRLPNTGVPLEWERALSPAFIHTPTYGTRASTILRLGRESVSVLEQCFTFEGPGERSALGFQRG